MRPDRPLASSPIASLLFAVVSLALCLVLITLAFRSPAAADAPLCAFSRQFERQLIRTDGILGAAVYDLDREIIWSGGHSGPYAMHSVIKPPIAWAVLSDAEAQGRELTTMQRDALFYMVAWSQNPDVELLLGMIGGLTGLAAYYERWGVPELTTLMHPTRWGINRATPRLVARLYAALATSRAIPEAARTDGLDLLRAVIDEHRWGAGVPHGSLPGWESPIKTGNFTIPESEGEQSQGATDGPQETESQVKAEPTTEVETPLESEASLERKLVRMNSAAIWLEPPWRGGRPRYTIAIMQESYSSWAESRVRQDQFGSILAESVVQHEAGQRASPTGSCLKRTLY